MKEFFKKLQSSHNNLKIGAKIKSFAICGFTTAMLHTDHIAAPVGGLCNSDLTPGGKCDRAAVFARIHPFDTSTD